MNRKSSTQVIQADILTVAQKAFDHLKTGFITGDFEPYFAMLTDDYIFYLPIEPARGEHRGIEKAREYYRMSGDSGSWLNLHTPSSITSNEKTVIFEFKVNGKIVNSDFNNRIAIALDVRGERICGFREYFGDVDPNFIKKLPAPNKDKSEKQGDE